MSKLEEEFARRFASVKKKITASEKRLQELAHKIVSTQGMQPASYWKAIQKQVEKEYVSISSSFSAFSKTNIPFIYKESVYELDKKVKALKNVTKKAKRTATQLIQSNYSAQMTKSLYQDAIAHMLLGVSNGSRVFNNLIRQTQQNLVDEHQLNIAVARGIEEGNIGLARKLMKNEFMSKLIKMADDKQFIVAGSRKYKPSYYAEMVARTKFHEAQSYAAKATAYNYGTDLVQVSSHNTTTEICQYYEGKIFSLSGEDKRFEFLDMEPPFHPNCLHVLSVTFESALVATDQLKSASDFSRGLTDRPPDKPSWIPIKDREAV